MYKKNYYVRWVALVMIMGFLAFVCCPSFGQGLSQFQSAVEEEADAFESIARTILDIILVLGAIGVIYAYVTKRQDAREYLIYYLIGVVVLGVLRQTVLGDGN
jgi:hypothetical protein